MSFKHDSAKVPAMRYLLVKQPTPNLEPKTLPQALNDASLIKAKPLELCLPCLLVLKVVANFCDKIETIAVTLLCCPLD